MKVKPVIISRKTKTGFGGLNRFYSEISDKFSKGKFSISPDSLGTILRLPFQKPTHIMLCDATLLPLGVLLKFLHKKPLIVTAHGLDITYPNALYQHMLRTLLPKTDAVVLDSKPSKDLLNDFNLKQKVNVIPLGVSLNHFKITKPISLPSLKNKIVLISVGNLVKRKGHLWFVKNVMPRLPIDFLYFIVGKGQEKQMIEKAIIDFNLSKRVFLLGQLTNPELGFVLKKTDIYVSPNQKTKANFESFGIALGEAAAIGIPVVASDVDGISEIIHNKKNGFLIKPTVENFIKTLKQLKNTKLRKKAGSRAKVFTRKNYTWEKTANAYTRLFASLDKN